MRVDIVPSGSINVEMMSDLGDLCEKLCEAGLDARAARAALPGVKDGGLTVAIAVSGVVLSAISSLVSALSYWSSQKPRYTITMTAGSSTLTISQLDKAGVQGALQQLRAEQANDVIVRIGHE